MTNTYFFGVGTTPPHPDLVAAIDTTAGEEGCDFIQHVDGSGQYSHWFAGPNRGSPFDTWMAARVYALLEQRGLQHPDGCWVRTEDDE